MGINRRRKPMWGQCLVWRPCRRFTELLSPSAAPITATQLRALTVSSSAHENVASGHAAVSRQRVSNTACFLQLGNGRDMKKSVQNLHNLNVI